MSTKYRVRDNDKAYFITITTVGWVDVFTHPNHKDLIVRSLKHCQKHKQLEIYAWCLMPSHLHMICRSANGSSLADIIRDFKKYTTKRLITQIQEEPESRREWMLRIFKDACAHLKRAQTYQLWQTGYHGEELFTPHFVEQKLNYLHQNPVKDKIVEQPEDYLYSSALNYADKQGLINVVVLSRIWKSYT